MKDKQNVDLVEVARAPLPKELLVTDKCFVLGATNMTLSQMLTLLLYLLLYSSLLFFILFVFLSLSLRLGCEEQSPFSLSYLTLLCCLCCLIPRPIFFSSVVFLSFWVRRSDFTPSFSYAYCAVVSTTLSLALILSSVFSCSHSPSVFRSFRFHPYALLAIWQLSTMIFLLPARASDRLLHPHL